MLSVFLVLFVVVLLLLWGKFPMEIVGMLSVVALVVLGAVSQEEATEGFGNGVVVTLGGLFVVGGALVKTGVAQLAGRAMERASKGEPVRLLLLVILVAATLSTVLSSTGTVALLIPAVVSAARAAGKSPSKFLIPLAYGSLIGGMITLVGGTPNLIANQSLIDLGRPGFGFFSFSWIGIPILLVALVYFALVAHNWLPERVHPIQEDSPSVDELLQEYGVFEDLYKVTLPSESRWKPMTLGESRFRSDYHVDVLAVRKVGTGVAAPPTAETLLIPGMVLFVKAQPEHLKRVVEGFGVEARPFRTGPVDSPLAGRALAELLLVPRSSLAGKSLAESRFFRRFGVRVVRVRRGGQNLTGDVAEVRLRFGDALLVEGSMSKISELEREKFDFVFIGPPQEGQNRNGLTGQAKIALALCFVMLICMVFNLLSPAIAALAAGIAMILCGCLTLEEAYGSIQWSSLLLVATMIPLGTALDNSGGLDLMAGVLLQAVGDHGVEAALLGVYLLATILGQVMSNTATALLLTPLAMDIARALNVAPEPMVLGVALGAAMSFLTPVASPVNTLVVGPGEYRFSDFLKIGIPLHIVASVICLAVIPWAFPFELGPDWSWPGTLSLFRNEL
ncbi:MAG: SLC13 family permease [Vulcanimicrobiota bacterium]